MSIIITDQNKIDTVKQQWQQDGCESFHILADFDRTLTTAFVNNQKSSTIIAQLRNGNYLDPSYNQAAHALFDFYAPIEKDPKISKEEKYQAMKEWWKKHFDLLVEKGLTKKLMEEIVSEKAICLRDGAKELFKFLKDRNIPLVIMSAAPEYMIVQYLKQENILFDNVHIIANKMLFDANGNFTGIEEPVVHSLNKSEIILHDFPIFPQIETRTNVLLLGDQVDDTGMITGFPYKTLLKIGFLNEKEDGSEYVTHKKQFKENFDITLTGDPDLGYINNLLKETFK